MRVVTPPALPDPEVQPADGARSVQPATRPSITFAEPVADRDAVVRSLAISPEVAGTWEWAAPDRVEFVPEGRLPTLTDITVTLHGGPDGARSAAGGYLENDVAWSFRTTDYKRIDVSLSRQVMTLMEDDVPVRSIVIATGVAGAQTPTGSYEVQYKLPQARFRGVNPSGLRYDIPDVNWVLAFWGDYTIHGAHWRARFGAPASNGCVSMSDPDAKVVYDWADVGTPITIHS
jgi:lipoprotein-anchoring transpeptidase ErfK/SrfK